MDDDTDLPRPYDPASMPASSLARTRSVWYRRPWVLVCAAIVVVVGASILVDLPRQVSTSDDVASQTASLVEINQDVSPCKFAVQETFAIYGDLRSGTLSTADRAQAPTMLRDDQSACSFTNSAIFDLTNDIQIQDTAAGKDIDHMLSVVTIWVTSDALAAVEDIQTLYGNPGNRAAALDLAAQERLLATDRGEAVSDVQAADVLLGGAHLPMPNLPILPLAGSSA